jgi:predicted GNAT family acetyltransferase
MSDDDTPRVITVSRNAAASRYELYVDGDFAGVLEYSETGKRIIMTHTQVFDEFHHTDAAETLASQSMADATERGLVIVPDSPYLVDYLEHNEVPGAAVEHPEQY